MNLRHIVRKLLSSLFISLFICIFFQFLIIYYAIPNNFNVPAIILIGFAIIIIGIFYFFFKIKSDDFLVVRIKFFNEKIIKIILLMLMAVAVFIPPVTFSDIIIAWNQIPIINYVRCIIFLIGALFLPGSCIFNLFFSKTTIYERLNIESFILKITIYPIISLAFLGFVTLTLDFIGFTQDFILFFLFFSIIFLFYLDVFFQKKRGDQLKSITNKITISRNTFLILLIGLGIVIIALGIFLSSHQYILAGDRWRGISSASLIGTGEFGKSQHTYAKYWGCVSFGLSKLCGIPYINTNTLLFPFLYLSITSIYILTKALLNKHDEKLCVLSSFFITLLFFPVLLIFQFSYHTFAFYTLFLSLTLFFIIIKSDNIENNKPKTIEKILFLALSAFFLVQSFILYFIPALMGFLTIFIYILFSSRIKHYFRLFLIFYAFFISFLTIFDLIALNFFSFWCFQALTAFTGIPFNFYYVTPFSLRIILTSLLFYSILLSSFLILYFIIYRFIDYLSGLILRLKMKIKFIIGKKKHLYALFAFFCLFFSFYLLIANLDLNTLIFFLRYPEINLSFLSFYLTLILSSIGFLGIFGLYLLYFAFKESKNQILFLLSWIALVIIIASSLIFIRWIQYPNSIVATIPENYLYYMIYWFSRTWYYSLIPISIISSIGVIRLILKLRSNRWFNLKYHKFIKSSISFFIISFLIVVSLSNPITTIIFWDNYYTTTNEDAQIIGWTSKNIPIGSKILITTWQFRGEDLYLFETYYLQSEMEKVDNNISKLIDNLTTQNIHYLILPEQWKDSYLALLDDFYSIKLYEYGSYTIYKSIEI